MNDKQGYKEHLMNSTKLKIIKQDLEETSIQALEEVEFIVWPSISLTAVFWVEKVENAQFALKSSKRKMRTDSHANTFS